MMTKKIRTLKLSFNCSYFKYRTINRRIEEKEGHKLNFCPNCDSLLYEKVIDGKSVLTCRCGYMKEIVEQEEMETENQEIGNNREPSNFRMEIIDEKISTLPTKAEECPKCKNKTAFYWQVQTRAGDEAMTIFFRCTKCRFTWREY